MKSLLTVKTQGLHILIGELYQTLRKKYKSYLLFFRNRDDFPTHFMKITYLIPKPKTLPKKENCRAIFLMNTCKSSWQNIKQSSPETYDKDGTSWPRGAHPGGAWLV